MGVARVLKHLVMPDWMAVRAFSRSDLEAIERAIDASEQEHDGELRFVVEGTLPIPYLGKNPRARAEDLFADLRVWDTEHNSGVLLYVQLVDRDIEIVADRGITRKVEQAQWEEVCRTMEASFKAGKFLDGSLEAIERVTRLLARHFPARGANPDELPDRPVVL